MCTIDATYQGGMAAAVARVRHLVNGRGSDNQGG